MLGLGPGVAEDFGQIDGRVRFDQAKPVAAMFQVVAHHGGGGGGVPGDNRFDQRRMVAENAGRIPRRLVKGNDQRSARDELAEKSGKDLVAADLRQREVKFAGEADLAAPVAGGGGFFLLRHHVPQGTDLVVARIRHRHSGAAVASWQRTADRIVVELSEPVQGVAPGQSLVLYQAEQVLGGGRIRETG